MTDLFAVVSGLDAGAVLDAVPPACRGETARPSAPRREGADTVMEWEWHPRRPARRLLPALSVPGAHGYAFRFEFSALREGRWSPWLGTATIGPAEFFPIAADAPGIAVEIDQCLAATPVEAIRMRLRLRAERPEALLAGPWLLTLSASDEDSSALSLPVGRARLEVPPLSQFADGGPLAARICSPTSVAMVLAYWRVRADLAGLAAEMRHPALDLYGVWPAAIAAAAQRGVLGYVLRFPDWTAAVWCLSRGLPIIASIRYAAGELSGAAIAETGGHLLVLTGWEGGDALVNDPAAPRAADVSRRYRLDELARVWLDRTGVGYVLFRPGSPPPSGGRSENRAPA